MGMQDPNGRGDGVGCSNSLFFFFFFFCLMKNLQFLHCHRAIKTLIMFQNFDSQFHVF